MSSARAIRIVGAIGDAHDPAVIARGGGGERDLGAVIVGPGHPAGAHHIARRGRDPAGEFGIGGVDPGIDDPDRHALPGCPRLPGGDHVVERRPVGPVVFGGLEGRGRNQHRRGGRGRGGSRGRAGGRCGRRCRRARHAATASAAAGPGRPTGPGREPRQGALRAPGSGQASWRLQTGTTGNIATTSSPDVKHEGAAPRGRTARHACPRRAQRLGAPALRANRSACRIFARAPSAPGETEP